MLINILHTIAITTSLGVVLTQPKNKDVPKKEHPIINKALEQNDYSIDLETNQSVWEYKSVIPNNVNEQINLYYGKTEYIDSTMTIEMISLNQETYTDSNHNRSWWLGQYGDTVRPNGKYIEISGNDTYYTPYVQSMYLVKVIPTNVNRETTLNVFNWYYMEDKQDYTKRIYFDMIQTTTDLDIYFTEPTSLIQNPYFTKYTKNSNLYDEYIDILYGTHGYNTTRIVNPNISTREIAIPINTSNKYLQADNNQNIQIVNNKTNYYIIYMQPYYYRQTGNGDLLESSSPSGHGFGNIQSLTTNEAQLNGIEVIPPTGSGEIVNIPGIMFTVLGMPFTFISTAFNLTIFPGTAYEVNISTLLLCVIAVLVFVFLIRIVVRVFAK